MYFRLQEKQAGNEKRTTHRRENDDLPALMPSSKRLKHSEESTSYRRHRTEDSSLDHHKSKREGEKKTRTEQAKDADSDSKSSKKKKSKEKRVDEVTRESNWLSSNLRVRIVDQEYKKGRFYNTKVIFTCVANKHAKVKILNSWQWCIVIVVPYHCVQVVVVDVVSLGTCVCQTDSGKLLEGK